MALPNPGMDAVPFTPLTAEFLDDMIENIESLSDGTGLENNTITANKVDFTTLATVYFKARPTGSVTVNTTPATKVFGDEIFDIGSNYNAGTGIFTAPVAGLYMFSGGIGTGSANTRFFCGFAVANNSGGGGNFSLDADGRGSDNSVTSGFYAANSIWVWLAAGATVQFGGFASATSTLTNASSHWGGCLIMRTT